MKVGKQCTVQLLTSNRHGAQGTYDEASNGLKETEFGTKNDDAVIEQILEKGDLQESKVSSPPTFSRTCYALS